MNEITSETIIKAVEDLKNQSFYYRPLYYEMTKEEWLKDKKFNFTAEEINKPDKFGKIGNKHGFDCYIKTKSILTTTSDIKKVKPNFNKLFK